MSMFITSLFLAVLTTIGCGSRKSAESVETEYQAGDSAVVQERRTSDGNLIQEIDFDANGRPEVFNYYRAADDKSRVLLRKESDLNRDGKIDVYSFFTDSGALDREEMDSDFDGAVDWVDHYQAGQRVSTEVDTDHNGKYDLFKYYSGGKITNEERDTNGDTRIDFWATFDTSGNVKNEGWDVDGDGKMDVRQE